MRARIDWLVLLIGVSASRAAWGEVGVQAGPHGGVMFRGDADPYLGLDLRLSVPSSPVLFQSTFDYVFDAKERLYQLGANALYEVPLEGRFKPYLGIGANVSVFALREQTPDVDDHGNRLGMNLLAGARLDLPWVSPFLQVTKTIGELDSFAVGGGLELAVHEKSGAADLPEPMRFVATPYLDNNVAGDVQSGRLGLGVSLAYNPWEHFGFELDAELHGHFFRDQDVVDLQAAGTDLNTKAGLLSGSFVARYCWSQPSFGAWCPYATAGAGVIHAWFDAAALTPGTTALAKAQTNPALTAGVGLTHLFTSHIGLRVDARYFRALVDEQAHDGGYFKDYGFLRVAVGASVGFR
jgi:opacity protein-like surface antigen